MGDSKKSRDFVREPMKDKDVTALAGIGATLGHRLKDKGFQYAYNVFGQFLILNKNKAAFVKWLKDDFRANAKEANDCYECLKGWCTEFSFE